MAPLGNCPRRAALLFLVPVTAISSAIRTTFLLRPQQLQRSSQYIKHQCCATMSTISGNQNSNRNSHNMNQAEDNSNNNKKKPRILCLHGKHQSGSIFSNKIAGARRKLARLYDLHFLDGPVLLNGGIPEEEGENAFAWWERDETTGEHFLVREGMEHVLNHIQSQKEEEPYQALIGFSQGGVVATALCCSGCLPHIKCVVTAGSPMVQEAFDAANRIVVTRNSTTTTANVAAVYSINNNSEHGHQVPKLHLAGKTDAMISVESTRALCETGGNGQLIIHEQGHLFPTRSARVQEMLDFLEQHLFLNENQQYALLEQQK